MGQRVFIWYSRPNGKSSNGKIYDPCSGRAIVLLQHRDHVDVLVTLHSIDSGLLESGDSR